MSSAGPGGPTRHIGRRLFDLTNGWDGKPAAGEQLVVVTHRPLPPEWLDDRDGVRFFGRHTGTVLLDDPDRVVRGGRVTHVHYTVRR